MRIVCTADLHGTLRGIDLPEGDVLVVAGDVTCYAWGRGQWGETASGQEYLEQFAAWIHRLPYPYKVVVAGNHDGILSNTRGVRVLEAHGLTYLQDSGCTIDGVRFWGIPWTPADGLGDRAFCMSRHSLKLHYAAIPVGTDILVCHAKPPIREIRHAHVQLVVYGHIASPPQRRLTKGVEFVCACMHRHRFEPVTVDVKPRPSEGQDSVVESEQAALLAIHSPQARSQLVCIPESREIDS